MPVSGSFRSTFRQNAKRNPTAKKTIPGFVQRTACSPDLIIWSQIERCTSMIAASFLTLGPPFKGGRSPKSIINSIKTFFCSYSHSLVSAWEPENNSSDGPPTRSPRQRTEPKVHIINTEGTGWDMVPESRKEHILPRRVKKRQSFSTDLNRRHSVFRNIKIEHVSIPVLHSQPPTTYVTYSAKLRPRPRTNEASSSYLQYL